VKGKHKFLEKIENKTRIKGLVLGINHHLQGEK
jgi:hypothetical protein